MAPPQSYENGASDTTATPAAKRRRIALACTACRLRKSRCDGRRPSCSSCGSLGFDCQYEPGESAANVIVRKEYMSDIDQRVSTVEQVVQRLNYVLEGHLTACAGDAQYRPTNPFPAMPPAKESLSSGAAGLEEPQDEDATTNGMAMTFIGERTSAFFGGSSNINFIRQLLSAVNHIRYAARREHSTARGSRSNELDESNMAKASHHYANSVAASPETGRTAMTALPSTQEMEAFLDVHFSTAGVVFPFIDEESFRKTYADAKATGFTRVRRTWLGSLNMIFAMACHFDRDSVKSTRLRKEKADVFFQRAIDLCGDLSKHVISLEIVHYLLLYVIHCQGSQRSVQAWNVHGLVIRSAMALGLQNGSTRDAGDDQQAEYRRRTWLVIYCIDKVLSVAFGRPVSIPDELMIDRLSTTEMALPSPDGSRSWGDVPGEFLNVSFRLYQVTSGCLKKQYGGNIDSVDQEPDEMAALQASGEFRKALRVWSSSLPSYLGLAESNASFLLENTQVNRLRVILTLRYHNINILIHRPLLGSTIRYLFGGTAPIVGNPSYLIQLAMGEAHECIRSAQSTIEIVYNIINGDQSCANNLGMEYFTLYYVFTASLVILGRILWAQHGQNVIDETALSACKALLGKTQVILSKVDQDNSLVDSCSRYLHNMLEVCTSQDATIAVQNDSVDDSSSVSPRFDHQPTSPSAPNPLGTVMDFSVGDLEMFQLCSSEMYDPGIFDGWDKSLQDSTTTRNTQ